MPKKALLISFTMTLFIIGFFIYMWNHPLPHEYFIFQDINECEQLIPTDQYDVMITRYDTPDKDKKLKGLSYNSFFGMKFKSKKLKYEIFAYEFVDSDSALKYYINVTGRDIYEKKLPLSNDDDNKLFLASVEMASYSLVVIYQNKAYLINAPAKYADDINKLFANTFSYQF